MSELEKLKNIQEVKLHGGARKGAGRPSHGKNRATIDREEAARQFKERVAKHTDKLFNAQLDLAVGEKCLMVKTTTGFGKDRRVSVDIVTDHETIKQFLDESLESSDTEYYFMTTKAANNMALDSLLNRSFGKAQEKIDLTTQGDKLIDTTPYPAEVIAQFKAYILNQTLEK